MNKERIYNREVTAMYISNEFSNRPIKVTTILDDDGCWTGKVVLEQIYEDNDEINADMHFDCSMFYSDFANWHMDNYNMIEENA